MQRIDELTRIRFTSGTIEALKWLALGCMVVDHVNLIAFDRTLGTWADVVGRLAMPIFALVFGYNLARPGVDRLRVAGRLAIVGALVTPLYALAIGVWPLNVLLTFALAAVTIDALEARQHGAVAGMLVAAVLVDYQLAGVGLVLCGFYAVRSGVTPAWLASVALVMLALCVLNGNAWALLALPLLWSASRLDFAVPRSRWAFLAAYPAHLAVIALLAGV